jgi:hypothetical protein
VIETLKDNFFFFLINFSSKNNIGYECSIVLLHKLKIKKTGSIIEVTQLEHKNTHNT